MEKVILMWKPKGARFFVKRALERIAEKTEEWNKNLSRVERSHDSDIWNERRDLKWFYSPFFSFGLNRFFKKKSLDLVDHAEAIHGGRKRPMRIIEDGPGKGVFLEQFVHALAEKGIKTEVTAVVLKSNPELESLKSQGIIENLEVMPAEMFSPQKSADFIISMIGSVEYVPRFLKKHNLLKYAYSLRKGGVLVAGFGGMNWRQDFPYAFPEIRKKLAKMGFRAQFYKLNDMPWEIDKEHSLRNADLPYYLLVLQRK